jgi:deferrochelatase/peroxidase EfeB
MLAFPNDALEDAYLHGDLSLQLCASHQDVVHHALRDIMRHIRGGMQLNWKVQGYASPPRPSGTGRNLLGFKDGTANPTGSLATALVWVDDPAEPAWAKDGSYQVVRLIRMLADFWDRVSINEQEGMFGRRRDSGAPLDGNSEFDTPDYAADPHGNVIPYQQDIQRQFVTVQTRLINEPLADYVQPFGGGYFFVLPGVRDASDWYGRGLLA